MYIENREYFEIQHEEALKDIEFVNACVDVAMRYKNLYELVKDRKGFMYRLIAKFAKKKNRYFVDKGFKVAQRRFGILGYDFQKLSEYIDSIKRLEDKDGLA